MAGWLRKIGDWVGKWLLHPWLPLHLALISVALCLPALGVGFQLDDYFQRMIMLDRAAHEVEAMEAFSLMRGETEYLSEYIDWGVFPWWTAEDLRLAFFRYLTVATVWLDYRLWPDSAPLMHVHSLVWLGALVATVALLYRRLMGSTIAAGLAGLLYAIDEAHAGAAAWLANRNALLATCFGVLCLVAHDRWRRAGRRWGAWGGPLLLALGLASGEMALAALGYLAAYALLLDPEGKAQGALALAGHAATTAVWVTIYLVGGYGTRGSGLYLNPLGDAAAYLAMLPERLPLLLLGQWTAISADAGWLLPPERARFAWLLGLVVIAVLTVALVPLLKRDPVARFWTMGMVLSLLPVAATFPSNRLLFFAGVGAMGLTAQLLMAAFGIRGETDSLFWPATLRVLGVGLIAFHLVLAPLMAPLGAHLVSVMGEPTKRAVASLPADPSIAERDLVIVNAPDYLTFVTMISTIRAVEEIPYPSRMRALSAGPVSISLTRLDQRTLRVGMEEGLYAGPLAELYRSRHEPLPAGSVIELSGMTVTIVADDGNGVPLEIDYHFDVPLEDSSLFWVRWQEGAYVAMSPPAPGEAVLLPPARGPFEQMARLFPL
jgi:hypothetical protein